MALASKTEDAIPPRTALLTNLVTTSSLISQLFATLSTSVAPPISSVSTSTNSAPLGGIYVAMQQTTVQLETLSQSLISHQRKYVEMRRKGEEVRSLEEGVRQALIGLESARKELDWVVSDSRGVLESIERLERGELFPSSSV